MADLGKDRRPIVTGWMSWLKDPAFMLLLAGVFFVDQVTKAWVRHSLFLGESVPQEGPLRITHTSNSGTAFGLFPDQTLFLVLGSIVGIGVLLLVFRKHLFASLPLRLALGMQVGGAAGNLVDRVRLGEVTDFIDVGAWPVFNVADASVVIGIAVIVYLTLLGPRRTGAGPQTDRGPNQSPQESPSTSDSTAPPFSAGREAGLEGLPTPDPSSEYCSPAGEVGDPEECSQRGAGQRPEEG